MKTLRSPFALLLALAVFAAFFVAERPADCALDASLTFVQVPGINGSSKEPKFTQWIEAAVDWGTVTVGPNGKGRPGTAGKFSDLKVTLPAGPDAKTFGEFAKVGKHVSTLTIARKKKGDAGTVFLKIVLTDAVVSNVSSAGGGVSLSFVIAGMDILWRTYKSDGTFSDSPVAAGYDLAQEK